MSSMILGDQSPSSPHQVASGNGGSRTSYFEGAHHLSLRNPNFLNVHGDYYAKHAASMGLAALNQQISHDAMFDSEARYSRGRVHPGTRKKVIEQILAWIDDPAPHENVLWVHGSAGIGKSAIMQTIAELLAKEQRRRYAGSFFFAKDIDGRKDGSSLFATLAYQTAIYLPGMRELIDEAMTLDPSLPTKSMDVQLEFLLLSPFRKCTVESLQHTPTVIIDGLDECHDSETQCRILSLIADAVNSPDAPLRFLIASRPEYWIRDSFVQRPLSSKTKKLSLNNPESGADDDIEKYLLDEFDRIYVKKSRFMMSVARPWPSYDIIRDLVRHAGGIFAYASTIIKFVGYSSDYCNPVKQLSTVTSPGPDSATAFTELDKLYTRILSVFPRPELLKAVLRGLVLKLDPRGIEFYLGVDLSEIHMVLQSLNSVVEIDKPVQLTTDEMEEVFNDATQVALISGYHLSFREFLLDQNRSGQFYIDIDAAAERVSAFFTEAIIDSLDGKPRFQDGINLTSIQKAGFVIAIFCVNPDQNNGRRRLLSLFQYIDQIGEFEASNISDCQSATSSAALLSHLECLEANVEYYTGGVKSKRFNGRYPQNDLDNDIAGSCGEF
ncbi:hypothetical protein CVT25_009558 [Psilocybe cyanescens]|uniref:NACHT domain-containing protein n=1 Tax=Psilocybe cyanescens TaxID=93625 RepID=A0A409XV55_PSICY|nr:hypothetical protein CVT25_009558 [Psilocybe cyanescens]